MEQNTKKPKLSSKMVKKQKMQNKKEENLREILNFYTNQIDARKFLQKMKAVVDSNQQEKKYQDDFLNPNEYAEMKDIYEDYNIGDLVIVFGNPDVEGFKNVPITYKEAEKFYDETLSQKNDDVSESQLKKEKEAFMLAFLTLDDFIDEKTRKKMKKEEEQRKKEKEEKEKEEKERAEKEYAKKDLDSYDLDSKSPYNDKSDNRLKKSQHRQQQITTPTKQRERGGVSNHSQRQKSQPQEKTPKKSDDGIELSDFDFDINLEPSEVEEEKQEEQEPEEEVKKVKELTSYEKYLQFLEKYNKIQKEKIENQENQDKLDKEKKQKVQYEPSKSLLEMKKSAQFKENNDDSINQPPKSQVQFQTTADDVMYMDPVKELFKINLADTKQFSKVKKQLGQGGYLIAVKEEDKIVDWICSNSQPKDYLTLIRFTIIEKLMRNAFLHCRQFLSADGGTIYLVIKSSKQVVMRQAQKVKVVKQVEMGFADLLSLEPVDSKLRPLRLKKFLRSYQSNSEEDQKIQSKLIEMSNEEREEKIITLSNLSNHCEQLYDKVVLWKDFILRLNLIIKQLEVDQILKVLAQDLNIDQSHEKAEILNDEVITQQEWQAYYIYLECILCFGRQIQSIKKSSQESKEKLKEIEAFIFKLVFRKALSDANQLWFKKYGTFWKDITNNKNILFNLWDRLELYPMAPYAEYFIPDGEAAKQLWRKYEFNEKKQRSEFLNMEKIKLTHAIVLKHINIQRILQIQYALFYIPIHDPYQLNGIPKNQFFQTLEDNEYINKKNNQQGDKKLDEVLVQLKSHAESTDYDCKSVKEDSAFNIKMPWHVPIQTYRDYFGEKIAIYFLFLQFYTKQLWYVGVVGVVFQGLETLSPTLKNILTVTFSSVIIIWSTLLIEYWKQEQVIFSMQFGQQNLEQVAAERPAFHGKFVRSVTSDNLNEKFYSPLRRQMTKLCAFGVSILIISMVVGSVLGIFFFKNLMISTKADALFSQTLPGILMSIQISVFTKVYAIVAKIFNFLENHKNLTSFENSLVAKNFIFRYVNNFNSFFLISFLSNFFPQLDICKVNEQITNNCFLLLENQLSTIFSSNLTGSIPKLITPFVKAFSMQQIKNKLFVEKQNTHPFKYIDTQIEDQLGLDPYQDDKEEVDGSVLDYLEITIQFCYLILFGVSFPAAYMMAFAQNILKIQVDKLRFQRFVRRPFPEGASSIGNWLIILDLITFLGIFVNAGLIVYTSGFFQENQDMIFYVVLISFLVLKYVIRFIIPSYPESATILNARHRCIVDKVVKGFSKGNNKPLIQTNFYSKIGGVSYDNDISELCMDEAEYQRQQQMEEDENGNEENV